MSNRRLHRSLDDFFGYPDTYECRVCGGSLRDGRQNYCSRKCRAVAYAVYSLYDWSSIRRRVLERDGYACLRCGTTDAETTLHVDHVVPLANDGPELAEENLQTLCESCNLEKGTGDRDWRPPTTDTGGLRERIHGEVLTHDLLAGDLQWTDTGGREYVPPAVHVLDIERSTPDDGSRGRPRGPEVFEPEWAMPFVGEGEPEPPESLPAYVTEPLDRQDADALEDVAWYVEQLRHARERERQREREEQREALGDADQDVDELPPELLPDDYGGWGKVYEKLVPCGPGCKGCPHGPYLYLDYQKADGTKTLKYLGKP